MKEVMDVVVTTVYNNIAMKASFICRLLPHSASWCKMQYFIRASGLNHREFTSFLADLETEDGELLYHTDTRKCAEEIFCSKAVDSIVHGDERQRCSSAFLTRPFCSI